MKKTMPILILAAALLGLGASVANRGGGDDWSAGKSDAPFGFGQHVAGAWLIQAQLGPTPFEAVVQISADGGTAMSNTLLPNGNTLATAFGSWKRIGPRTIAMTHLIRIVNAQGVHVFYEKVVSELTIEGDEFSGESAGLVYLPTQDPLDPEANPVVVLGPGPLMGRRIVADSLPE